MDIMKDDGLANNVEQDRYRDQVTNAREGAAHEMAAMLSIESHAPEKVRQIRSRIGNSVATTDDHRHDWLQNESEFARTGKTSRYVVKESFREEIRTVVEQIAQRTWHRGQ